MLMSLIKKLNQFWNFIPAPPTNTDQIAIKKKIVLIAIVFLLACLFRYVHHLDLAPLVKNGQQDFAGITAIHDGVANNIANKGVNAIFPSRWPISDTSLLQYPPGYGFL